MIEFKECDKKEKYFSMTEDMEKIIFSNKKLYNISHFFLENLSSVKVSQNFLFTFKVVKLDSQAT